MPVLDGFEATRQIRAAEAAAGAAPLPIVALTAHVIGTASSDWVEAGMNAVLHKPFTLKAMADCIAGLLAPRHGPAQAPPEDGKAPPETAAMAARGVSPDEAEAPVIDARTLGELSAFAAAGRSDFVARVVGLYRDHAPKAARDIAARADAGGGEPLAKAAHALKSMSLNIGARRVAALASEIETEAKAGRAPAPDAIERLGVLVAEACAHLARRVDTTPGEDRAPAPRVSGAA
jgi:two-component system sensor histidine kinase BarA